MKSRTPKPGEFRAVCKKGSWQPLDKLTAEQLADVESDKNLCRWDSQLKTEVAIVECALETTDRAAYFEHMTEVHGLKPAAHINSYRGYAAWPTPSALSTPWRAPKLHEDGAPFKSRDGVTETCPTCGLVSELPPTAGDLGWRTHLEQCAAGARGVA